MIYRCAGLLLSAMLLIAAGCGRPDGRERQSGLRSGPEALGKVSVEMRRSPEGGKDEALAQVGQLVLVAPSSRRAQLQDLAEDVAERWPGLVGSLGTQPTAPFALHLVSPRAQRSERSEQVRRMDSLAPPWAAGYLFGAARVGGVRLELVDRYPYKDALSVTLHEATHQILFDAVGSDHLPRWFEEGAATVLGQRWGVKQIVLARKSVAFGGVPLLAEIDAGFASSARRARLSYSASYDFVAWSERRYGKDLIRRVLEESRQSDFKSAWLRATGEVLAGSERRWRRGALFLYRVVPLLGSSGTLWILMSLLAVAGGGKRRLEFQRRMARWRAREAAAEGGSDEETDDSEPNAEDRDSERGEEQTPGLSVRERARVRWGLPPRGARPPDGGAAESSVRRKSEDGEWIN